MGNNWILCMVLALVVDAGMSYRYWYIGGTSDCRVPVEAWV